MPVFPHQAINSDGAVFITKSVPKCLTSCVCLACAVFVSDFIFVQGTAVIFKVALCLLSSHEGEIVECDSFETIVDYLKTTLPALSQTQMEQTIAKVQTGS